MGTPVVKDDDRTQLNVNIEKTVHTEAKTIASRLGMKLYNFTEFGLKVWLNFAKDLSVADTAKLAKGEYCLVALIAVKKRLSDLGLSTEDLEPLDVVYQKAVTVVEQLSALAEAKAKEEEEDGGEKGED